MSTRQVNVLDAKNALSELLRAVEDGDDVVIARRGVPVARLVAVTAPDAESGRRVVDWLRLHPLPTASRRTASQLDERIAQERDGWE